jgi:hypothetical protein
MSIEKRTGLSGKPLNTEDLVATPFYFFWLPGLSLPPVFPVLLPRSTIMSFVCIRATKAMEFCVFNAAVDAFGSERNKTAK